MLIVHNLKCRFDVTVCLKSLSIIRNIVGVFIAGLLRVVEYTPQTTPDCGLYSGTRNNVYSIRSTGLDQTDNGRSTIFVFLSCASPSFYSEMIYNVYNMFAYKLSQLILTRPVTNPSHHGADLNVDMIIMIAEVFRVECPSERHIRLSVRSGFAQIR